MSEISNTAPSPVQAQKRRTPVYLSGYADLIEGFNRHQLWVNLAWEDLLQTYYRTGLGLLWGPLSFLFRMCIFVLLFWRLIAENNFAMVACYIATGFVVWDVMSGCILQGSSLFKSNQNWIKSSTLPFSVFAFQKTAAFMFRFALNSLVVVGILIGFRQGLSATLSVTDVLFSLLGLVFMVINMIWVQVFIGLLCVRFRDLQHFIEASIMMLFFLTPVIWRPHFLGDYATIIYGINPFTHFIEVFRDPLLQSQIPVTSWIVVGSITVVGHLLTWLLLGIFKKKLAFWV